MVRLRHQALIVFVFWLTCLFVTQATAAGRFALVIGNSEYRNAPRLPNPVNDARDVAAAFERLGFSVKLLSDGSYDAMRRALLEFAPQAQAAEIAVVFFAGHGMEIRDENWLIPVDAEMKMDISTGQEAISLGSIMPIVSRARKLGLVILDACRDNPFGKQLQMSQPGRSLPGRGLAPIEPPGSVLVAFAAKHGTTADDGAGRNSPFTTALLRNLELPGLEINYLFRNIHDEVYGATQQRQEPYVYGTLSREPIYLKTSPDATPSGSVAGSEAAQAWGAIKDTSDPAALSAFISRFDNTFYSDLARNRLAQLNATRPGTTTQQTANLAPRDRATAQPAPPADDPQAAGNGLVGQWSWRAQCPVFGSYQGTLQFTEPAAGKLAGVISDDEGDWKLFDGRAGDGEISFRRKVKGGATQYWKGRMDRPKSGKYLLKGTATDSRFSIGNCTWQATKAE
jgi:Caspase domain